MHFGHKKEIDQKGKEASESRGQAKAFTAVGAAGAAAWGLMESGILLDAMEAVFIFSDVSQASKKTWQKVAFATGIVTLGAMGLALYKHNHAHKLEAEKQKLTEDSQWQDRVEQERAAQRAAPQTTVER